MSFLRNIFSKKYGKALSISLLGGFTYIAYNHYNTVQLQLPSQNVKIQQQIRPIAIIKEQIQVQKKDQIVKNDVKEQVTPIQADKKQIVEERQVQKTRQQKAKQQEKQIRLFSRLNQIVEYKFDDNLNEEELVLIVADLPFNENFQKKIVNTINQIKAQHKDVKIYRKDILQNNNRESLKNKYRATIKDQTIFLLKNSYDPKMNNIDFDIFTQFPDIINIYLKKVHFYNHKNINQLAHKLANLSPHESTLIYLYDQKQTEQKIRQRLMTAKFVEMELLVNNLKGINVEIVDKNVAIENNLINESNSRTNSLHLFRKHNIYTPFDPNYKLNIANKQIDFHRLSDIALFQKGSNSLMIPSYLSSLQTFDSQQLAVPFLCTLKVDRNKISEDEYNKLLLIFGKLKKIGSYPDVGFGLKLKEVGFLGKDVPQNKCWQITMTLMDELDKQSMMHEIKTRRQLSTLGIKEEQYLKTTQQYLYQHNVIDQDLIQSFINQASKGLLKKYHKSQEKNVLANLRKLVGSNYEEQILKNDFDHLIYQFSESCPTCKKISPIISAFQNIIRQKEYGLNNLMFYRMDANKNRTPYLMTSPYIPNIYYIKKEWKQYGPVRFPIELFNRYGVSSLFYFCIINKQIKTISWDLVNKAVQTSKQYKYLNI